MVLKSELITLHPKRLEMIELFDMVLLITFLLPNPSFDQYKVFL